MKKGIAPKTEKGKDVWTRIWKDGGDLETMMVQINLAVSDETKLIMMIHHDEFALSPSPLRRRHLFDVFTAHRLGGCPLGNEMRQAGSWGVSLVAGCSG